MSYIHLLPRLFAFGRREKVRCCQNTNKTWACHARARVGGKFQLKFRTFVSIHSTQIQMLISLHNKHDTTYFSWVSSSLLFIAPPSLKHTTQRKATMATSADPASKVFTSQYLEKQSSKVRGGRGALFVLIRMNQYEEYGAPFWRAPYVPT